jgi:D-amino peptidase
MTDIEGVSGVVSFKDQAEASGRYYEQAKRLLTAELNAAVEGVLEHDIDDVIVWDGHGAGGVAFEHIHPNVKLIHGNLYGVLPRVYDIIKTCDVGMMIGQHAMAGVVDGNLNHTQNSEQIIEYRLNNEPIGEIAQCAYSLGVFNIPLIYLSGDHAACREIKTLIPDVITTAVKEGIGRNAALSIAPKTVHKNIKTDVTAAITRHKENPIKPTVLAPPYQMDVTCTNSLAADQRMALNKLSERINSLTYRVESDNLLDIIYG